MPNLKTAQEAFTKARAAYKVAQENTMMPGNEKEQMAEQVIALADELVSVAIESVEGGGQMGNEMITPGSGVAEPDQTISTDIPGVVEDPDKKLNTAELHGKEGDDGKIKDAKDDNSDNNEIKDMRKELDAMKAEKIALKLAQKYSELYPVAMRSAMKEAFLSHREPTKMLEARLDEASTILAKPQAMKIAQQEDSVFNFDDLDSTRNNSLDTGAKI